MAIIKKLERKQLIVILFSAALAIASYFIPVPEQTQQVLPLEQGYNTPLPPAPVVEHWVFDSAAVDHPLATPNQSPAFTGAKAATDTDSVAAEPATSQPLVVDGPSHSPTAVQEDIKDEGAGRTNLQQSNSPVVIPKKPATDVRQLTVRDFYTGPYYDGLNLLPVTQDAPR